MGNHVDEVQDMADAVAFMRSQGRRVVCLLGHRCG
jgi:cobalamin synthase